MDDGFSTVDGFVEVNQSVVEMIKYVANEPSVGLYYVQQHTRNSLPNLLHLQGKVVNRTHETTLHTQDLEDSINAVQMMNHCGPSIAHDMINDINKSLLLVSTTQSQSAASVSTPTRRGSIHAKSSGRPIALSRGSVFAQQDTKSSGSYFSTVLQSAKQKAVSLKWPQLNPEQSIIHESEQPPPNHSLDAEVLTAVTTLPDTEAEELPFSSQILEEQLDDPLPTHDLLSESENYEEYKAKKEAKLMEWLEEHEDPTKLKNKDAREPAGSV